MGLWFRAFFMGFLALGLTGCNLQSKEPLFSDAQAKLLLADYPNPVTYEYKDNGWKKSDEQASFTPQASHYVAKLDTSEVTVSFMPIDGPWWALQAVEPGKSADYLLVKAAAKELIFYTIDCKTLEDSGKFMADIEFKDSDCLVKPEADKMALFKGLTAFAGDPMTKLVSGQ